MDRAARIVAALADDHTIVAGYETSEGDDEGPYLNFTFLAKDPTQLWARLKTEVLAHPEIGRNFSGASIIICEGKAGWDDYLLLHHYDRTQQLDEPEGIP